VEELIATKALQSEEALMCKVGISKYNVKIDVLM